MRKIKMALIVMLLSIATISAQGVSDTSSASMAVEKTEIFVDSLGREVQIPKTIERVAPSGNLSQQIIYSIVPDRMVGWGTKPTAAMNKYFKKEILEKPVFGAFYGAKANLNKEALIVADPQIVVDIGEIKGSKEDMIKDLDQLQEDIGIPVVFISAYLDKMGQTYRDLGNLFDIPSEGEERAAFCDKTIEFAKTAEKNIKDKVSVYYGTGSDGLISYPSGSFHTQALDLSGASNVVTGKGNNLNISIEQLLIWNPQVMLITQEGGYDQIMEENSPFADLDAVKNKEVFIIPEGPFNWLDRPPAMNRILGILWVGNLLYPDVYNIDIKAEAKSFYSLFYHYNLSDEQVDNLLKYSQR